MLAKQGYYRGWQGHTVFVSIIRTITRLLETLIALTIPSSGKTWSVLARGTGSGQKGD
jgi:hypothetical protein